jgi:hypothetical protein
VFSKNGRGNPLFLPGHDRAAGGSRQEGYWKSSLNMAQPEAGGEEEVSRYDETLRLNTFPRPARAKQIRLSMRSFFIVP